MKILLKAQACLPLHLPLGFTPDLSPSPRTPPFVSSLGMDRDQRVKALVSGAGSGWSQGAEDRQTRGHPTTLQPHAGRTRAGLAGLPPVLVVALDEGLYSQPAGRWPRALGPLPAIVLPPLLPFPSPCGCSTRLPATGLSLRPPGTKGKGLWVLLLVSSPVSASSWV